MTEATAPEAAPTEAAAPVTAAPAHEAKFVGDKPRLKSVFLEWPIEYDGKVYDCIHLVRMTAKEVAEWIESIQGKDNVRFPLYRDEDGNMIPGAVMDALDDDDMLALNGAAKDFLPRRFLGADQASASAPEAGGHIAPL